MIRRGRSLDRGRAGALGVTLVLALAGACHRPNPAWSRETPGADAEPGDDAEASPVADAPVAGPAEDAGPPLGRDAQDGAASDLPPPARDGAVPADRASDRGGSDARPLDAPAPLPDAARDLAAPDLPRDLTVDQPPDQAVIVDPARYHFDLDTQGWRDIRAKSTPTRRSTARAFAGMGALEVTLDTASIDDERYIGVQYDFGSSLPAGTKITFHVWFPQGGIYSVQPFVLYFPTGKVTPQWEGNWKLASDLATGAWNTMVVTVPADAERVVEVGVEWRAEAVFRGTVYIDSVTW